MRSDLKQLFRTILTLKDLHYNFEIITHLSKEDILKVLSDNIIDDFQISFLHNKNYFYGKIDVNKFYLHPIPSGNYVYPRLIGYIHIKHDQSIVHITAQVNYRSVIMTLVAVLVLFFLTVACVIRFINNDQNSIFYSAFSAFILFLILHDGRSQFKKHTEECKARLIKLLSDKSDSDAKVI